MRFEERSAIGDLEDAVTVTIGSPFLVACSATTLTVGVFPEPVPRMSRSAFPVDGTVESVKKKASDPK
jgi:hypothetical protein